MAQFIYSLGLIIAGIFLGKLLREGERTGRLPAFVSLPAVFPRTTRFAMLWLNPIVIVGVFWNVELRDIELALLPLLGILAVVVGGFTAILFARLQRLDRAQTGSMFVSGSFTNMGNFGTLFCFVFFGEQSLVYVAMFRLLEDFVYYFIGFPIARLYGTDGRGDTIGGGLRKLLRDPFILTLTGSMAVGLLLNLTPIVRPAVYAGVIDWVVPLATILLVTSIGYNMKLTAIRGYWKQCVSISAIKFFIVPLCVFWVAFFLGIGELHDGIVLKVVLILSAMPPAFASLIPPQLYKLDADLANSSWLFNSGMLIVVLPLLYAVVQSM